MPHSVYHTSDIALAAYLLTSGCQLAGVEQDRRTRATFQFRDTAARPKEVLRFMNGRATVEPSSFLNNLKNLKAMISQG